MNLVSQNNRPYFSFSYNQLFDVADNNWNDIDVLQTLNGELNHRNRPWTLDLKNQVAERLEWLENQVNSRNLKNRRKLEKSEGFPWVSTEVGFGFEKMDTSAWKKDDLLSKLGYKTGNYSGLDTKTRREILYKAYLEDFPMKIKVSLEDIESWGEPNSATRLRKIAESIALVVRNEKMHSYDYTISISERETDLADLKKKFYDGVYDKF